jgi:hypothetical protein
MVTRDNLTSACIAWSALAAYVVASLLAKRTSLSNGEWDAFAQIGLALILSFLTVRGFTWARWAIVVLAVLGALPMLSAAHLMLPLSPTIGLYFVTAGIFYIWCAAILSISSTAKDFFSRSRTEIAAA